MTVAWKVTRVVALVLAVAGAGTGCAKDAAPTMQQSTAAAAGKTSAPAASLDES
jgi:hypothetical protein